MNRQFALETMFAQLWTLFIDGRQLDSAEMQDLIEKTGLATWREASEADMHDDAAFDLGDPILVLTDEGHRVVSEAAARQAPSRSSQNSN
jgi:hypothetical protein